MKVKTFEEWRVLGYVVSRGQRSTGRNAQGLATFTRDQVEDAEVPDQEEEVYRDEDGGEE